MVVVVVVVVKVVVEVVVLKVAVVVVVVASDLNKLTDNLTCPKSQRQENSRFWVTVEKALLRMYFLKSIENK